MEFICNTFQAVMASLRRGTRRRPRNRAGYQSMDSVSLTPGLTTRTEVRRCFVVEKQLDFPSTKAVPLSVSVNLRSLMGVSHSALEWFEEFIIDRCVVSVINCHTNSTHTIPTIQILGVPQHDGTPPSSFLELYRTAGTRQLLWSNSGPQMSSKPILFKTNKPVFSVTGDSTDYINKWLPIAGNNNVTWQVGVVGISDRYAPMSIVLILECHCRFRGLS